jgi:hypothetical protein
LIGAAAALKTPTGLAIALIWSAHVGIDRALGYGLKYNDAFASTHLGRLAQKDKAQELA